MHYHQSAVRIKRGALVAVLIFIPVIAAAALVLGARPCWRCWITPGVPHDASGFPLDRSRPAPGLKILASAQADFRSSDRDGNGVMDLWREDVAGLYVLPGRDGQPIKLVELSVAGADDRPRTDVGTHTLRRPRTGYWYRAIRHADEESPNPDRFAFCMYPADPPPRLQADLHHRRDLRPVGEGAAAPGRHRGLPRGSGGGGLAEDRAGRDRVRSPPADPPEARWAPESSRSPREAIPSGDRAGRSRAGVAVSEVFMNTGVDSRFVPEVPGGTT